ncbi:hypothetical protein JYK00_07265 [Thermosipho ferrireducens]|uniref:Receptor ligand binding region domain-containing protein n=1 Tax=Thermosipho ferrireducens TaxID=2571116 RepID=A0ABX7S4W1_9BACT|nr:hypothetical protein [Thermosipho ferrireducens]QTA37526.1 hypothetical protein JYK00_07265 [Thermosipho ferrireducens]
MDLKSFHLFLALIFCVFLSLLFWYFYASNYVGFLYSVKNSSYYFPETYSGNLKLVTYSEMSAPEKVLRKFKSKGVNIVIGPTYSTTGELFAPYLEYFDVIAFSPTITSWELLNKTDRIFSFSPDNNAQINAIKNFLKARGINNILLILDPMNKKYSEEFKKLLDYFSGTEFYFYSLKTFLKKELDYKNFEAVVITITTKSAVDIISQTKSLNPNMIFVCADAAVDTELIDYAKNAKEEIYGVSFTSSLKDPVEILINDAVNAVEDHKFISAQQALRFYKNHYVRIKGNLSHFNKMGFLDRPVDIVKLTNRRINQ